jgi:uncharacterized lipoprotein YajG
MKKKFLIITMAGFLVVSCSEENNSVNETEPIIEMTDKSSQTVALQLNNGDKWEVNPEMMPFLKISDSLVNSFSGENFGILAEELKSQNKKLISSCTMTGSAHDELHKWLHPHLELVQQLDTSSSTETSLQVLGELKLSFVTFNTYFH